MATYRHNNRVQRSGGQYSSNEKHRGGSFHRNVNTLIRLGSKSSAAPVVGKNVPKPIQTCSLKKENGGQDVTAVLVNRNNGSGKKLGWGSALPPNPANSSNTFAAEPEPTKEVRTKPEPPKEKQQEHYPPLPPSSLNKNVPWAMHPPTTTQNQVYDEDHNLPPSQQEKGEKSLQHERYYYRNDADYHDRRHQREYRGPHYNSYDHNHYNRGGDRYYRDDRQYRRGNSDGHKSYRERPDYRDYRDYRDHQIRYKYEPHAENYDRGRRHSEMENERYNTSYDMRNHVPNSYYRSEERRWGDDDDSFTQKSYAPKYNDMTRRHERENGREPVGREDYYRKRNHDLPPGRGYSNYHYRNTYDEPCHPGYSANTDERRPQDTYPPRSQGLVHGNSEEDIVLQAIREREAAEARAKQRNEEVALASTEEKYSLESSNNTPAMNGPVVILRNKQTSGEASSDISEVDPSREEKKNLTYETIQPDREEREEDNENHIRYNKPDLHDDQTKHQNEAHIAREKTNSKYSDSVENAEQQSTTATERDIHFTPKTDLKSEEEVNDDSRKDALQSLDVQEVKDQRSNETTAEKSENAPEPAPANQKEEEDDAAEEEYEANLGLPHLQDRKALEQQNVLLRVVASRESSKKKKTMTKKKMSSKEVQVDADAIESSEAPTVSKTVDSAQQKVDEEERVRTLLFEHKKTRGPRTNGVLFRRLEDGTLINADWTAEEIAAMEEKRRIKHEEIEKNKQAKRLAKEEKIRAREEKMKLREEKMKAREDKLKSKEEKEKVKHEKVKEIKNKNPDTKNTKNHKQNVGVNTKNRVKDTMRKEKSSKNSERAVLSNAIEQKPKMFVPAPMPTVSAWEAGPPRSVLNVNAKKTSTTEGITSMSNDKPAAENQADNATKVESASYNSSDTLPCEPDVSIDKVIEKIPSQANWNPSEDRKDDTQQSQFSAVKHISLPMSSNVETWNAFGASNLFTPPHGNNSNWGLGNENDQVMGNWADTSQAAPEEDEAALVPRDLLSSAPVSEEDEAKKEKNASEEILQSKDTKKQAKNDLGRKRPFNRNYKRKKNGNFTRTKTPKNFVASSENEDKESSNKRRYRPKYRGASQRNYRKNRKLNSLTQQEGKEHKVDEENPTSSGQSTIIKQENNSKFKGPRKHQHRNKPPRKQFVKSNPPEVTQ